MIINCSIECEMTAGPLTTGTFAFNKILLTQMLIVDKPGTNTGSMKQIHLSGNDGKVVVSMYQPCLLT